MKIGITNKKTLAVAEKDTAKTHGSGTLDVLATPALAALMEATAMESVMPFLDEGTATVGTELQLKHLSATPIGGFVTSESELVEVDGRRLVFNITAADNKGKIAECRHERFVISTERFMEKAQQKLI